MNRSRIAAMIVTSVFLAACGSGGSQKEASPAGSSTVPVESSSPTVAVQTAIPDGIYRTRPRTEQDLVILGLTKQQIDSLAKNVEQWKKSIIYELRIRGNQFVLTAASDGQAPIVADQGTFTVTGHILHMVYVDMTPEYTMKFGLSDGELRLKVLHAYCAKIDPDHCSVFMVRAAYEALPFEAVS